MRLFKRRCSDPSPELVSATRIPQDGSPDTAAAAADSETAKVSRLHDGSATKTPCNGNFRPPETDRARPIHSATVSARKGISTWGRKVGKRWDQLKRSDSSELLSVSGRRRRWSPNRKSCGDVTDEKNEVSKGPSSPELPKPKRISRVESLRNLFRTTGEKCGNSSGAADASRKSVTIREEETSDDLYTMDKSLSEGMLKSVPFRDAAGNFTGRVALQCKKWQLSRSIQNLQEQQRALDYILQNQSILMTREGAEFARETLDSIRRSVSPKRRDSSCSVELDNCGLSDVSAQTRKSRASVKRNLFNVRSGGSDSDRIDVRRSFATTGLEDLMSNLRLGCDESGYDSDSTRAGADSPDSGQSVSTMLKPRSFSITSDDYHGVDLSLTVSTSVNKDPPSAEIEQTAPVDHDETVIASNEETANDAAARTDVISPIFIDDDADTDSCDEDTFAEFEGSQFSGYFLRPPSALEDSASVSNDSTKTTSVSTGTDDINTPLEIAVPNVEIQCTTPPPKRPPARIEDPAPPSWCAKLRYPRENAKTIVAAKGRQHSTASIANLLENAASPGKDSPPANKVLSRVNVDFIRYYSPKRTHSNMDADASEALTVSRKMKRTVFTPPVPPPVPPKPLVRRELKTMKLFVEHPGSLGVSVEKREAVRPFYVVSKLDADGEAAKSKQIRLGDEVVRVSGRRLRGMSVAEARTALRNCVGSVELQIAREPTFAFGGEFGDTWGDVPTRARSDSEVWTLQDPSRERSTTPSTPPVLGGARDTASCEIVGALTKDGKNVSVTAMDLSEDNRTPSSHVEDNCHKMTGMKKFQVVRKRNLTPASYQRRATGLSMELLTVNLEKGASKKLGFSIVGGSDSNKGSMGIFVKDVMAGGQAAEEGTLRVGDEVLAINGASVDGLTHGKALQMFKTAKPGKLVLHIGRRGLTHKRLFTRR